MKLGRYTNSSSIEGGYRAVIIPENFVVIAIKEFNAEGILYFIINAHFILTALFSGYADAITVAIVTFLANAFWLAVL